MGWGGDGCSNIVILRTIHKVPAPHMHTRDGGDCALERMQLFFQLGILFSQQADFRACLQKGILLDEKINGYEPKKGTLLDKKFK